LTPLAHHPCAPSLGNIYRSGDALATADRPVASCTYNITRAGSIMTEDLADGLLLDVRGITLADPGIDEDGSALDRALQRLLTSNLDTNYNSFSSVI
jgi:hypothetical protein